MSAIRWQFLKPGEPGARIAVTVEADDPATLVLSLGALYRSMSEASGALERLAAMPEVERVKLFEELFGPPSAPRAAMGEYANYQRADRALHVLWTWAVGQPGYDKGLWKELGNAIYLLATDGPGEHRPSDPEAGR